MTLKLTGSTQTISGVFSTLTRSRPPCGSLLRHEGNQYLQIKVKRAASALETIGWYVAVPMEQDFRHMNVFVTPHVDEALPLSALPLHYIYK